MNGREFPLGVLKKIKKSEEPNMLRFTNCTTKETFKTSIRWSDIKAEKLESSNKNQKLWKISDRFSNVWEVLFTGDVNEFRVSYHDEFSVDLLS